MKIRQAAAALSVATVPVVLISPVEAAQSTATLGVTVQVVAAASGSVSGQERSAGAAVVPTPGAATPVSVVTARDPQTGVQTVTLIY